MKLSIEEALRQGVTAHKEGKLQDAERLYRAILKSQPQHPDANHNLGVLAVSVNKAEVALPLFKTALEANPKIEQFWLSYIDALIKEKQFDNAKKVLKQAKTQGVGGDKLNVLETQLASINKQETVGSLSPSQEQLSNLLEYYQNGQLDDAEKLAVSTTTEFPKNQFGWKILGAVLAATGRNSEAVNANQKAVALSPQDVEAHYNLGITLKELGRLDEALASYRRAIALKPDYAEAHRHFTLIKKYDGKDEHYSKMQELYLSKNISKEQRCHINFGLANDFDGECYRINVVETECNGDEKEFIEKHISPQTDLQIGTIATSYDIPYWKAETENDYVKMIKHLATENLGGIIEVPSDKEENLKTENELLEIKKKKYNKYI